MSLKTLLLAFFVLALSAPAQAQDNSVWAKFLQTYSTSKDNINWIQYGDVSPEDHKALKGYIDHLETTKVSTLSRPEQMAFWINLYNAATIDVILDHYPVETIRDIDISGIFSNGPWGKEFMVVEGRSIALNTIEHEILRPDFKDPRIHYAVNCASIGCPNLQDVPFAAETLEDQLNQGAVSYVNHPRGVTVTEENKLVVSSIYHWFSEDFGDSDENVIAHIKQYAAPDLKAKLEGISKISDHEYDWSLNELKN